MTPMRSEDAPSPGAEDTPPARGIGRLRELRHSNSWIFTTMLVSSCVSLIASLVLSIEALHLAANPDADLHCDINSVISCGTVGSSWQSELFGFPNAFLGLIAEPVVITLALACLGGVRFPRWFMFGAQIVYTLGFVFAYWLFSQSMLEIGALCPWCLVVTVSTTSVFTTMTHVNIRDNNLYLPPRVQSAMESFVRNDLDLIALTIWFLTLALLIVAKYGAALFG